MMLQEAAFAVSFGISSTSRFASAMVPARNMKPVYMS